MTVCPYCCEQQPRPNTKKYPMGGDLQVVAHLRRCDVYRRFFAPKKGA